MFFGDGSEAGLSGSSTHFESAAEESDLLLQPMSRRHGSA